MTNNKIEVSFKLEDIPMIIETLEKIQNENKQLKEKIENVKNYIKWHYNLGTKENVEFCLLRDRLLDILGDKE